MQIAIAKIGDTRLLVTPDEKPVPHQDSETPVFHIQPQLHNPYNDINQSDISLVTAELSFGGTTRSVSVLPDDVVIRQPYPSKSCYVAGTSERKMGWVVPIDLGSPPQWLDLKWKVQIPSDSGQETLVINHRFVLELHLTQQGHVFSMDQAETFYDRNAQAISFINVKHATPEFTKGDRSFIAHRPSQVHGLSFHQTLKLHSCAWSDLLCTEVEEKLLAVV